MENHDNYKDNDEQEETRDAAYGDVPSMSSPHTRIDATQIKPTGTGCRTLVIFVLIISVVLGFIYLYKQNQSPDEPIRENTPPGQTR
jgi:hypothetical protein